MSNQQQYPNHPPFEGGPQFQPAPPKKPRSKGLTVLIVGGSILGGLVILGVIGSFLPDNTVKTADSAPLPNVVTTTTAAPSPEPVVTPTTKPTATDGTGCDLNSSPEEYSDCLDRFVNGTTATPKPTKIAPAMTASQEQAIGAAEDYLAFSAFSRKGLIEQLSSEYGSGFSKADATFAVDHIKVNWNEQAAKAAKNYLETSHFSRAGLIQQLESEYGSQFTHKQAVYGVSKAGL